ncbi:PREDICTED: dirigent protein 22-like [Nelumbo nucifera]|uniref:Dirigent protein n=2 Tax=Nelumbo nucifera TaxID=4432 RepID=A0A1U7ZV62_NELNU|nr:PREDICTED: dirigent protein 22-like [Nelumbo nucifera]DAD42143.1 TPA_asm: hypothetical protein HUJ06_000373 [Nelumbo nucifera]
MARILSKSISSQIIFITFFFFSSSSAGVNGASHNFRFSRILLPQEMGLKQEKITHFHFYFHEIVGGSNPTSEIVAGADPTDIMTTKFGTVRMMDIPLTETPDLTSKLVGRSQGIYASSSQSEASYLMALDFVFMEGKHNGSTLSILGRNPIFSGLREMSVVGGSGVFRFARGYAQAKTHSLDPKAGHAIVEYNVFVIHY